MQRRKIGKISIFSSLDVIFDFLTSRVENSNRVLIQSWYQIESECWNWVFKSSQKIDIEYSSRVRRLISKLNLMISLNEFEFNESNNKSSRARLMMLKLLKLFIDVKECLNSLMKDEWLSIIKISSEENDDLSEIIDVTL